MSHHKPFHKHFVSGRRQRGKYLIPGLSWAAPSIFTHWPTEHSSQQQAASQGYLCHGSCLTNLLANTCSKPEGSLERRRRRGEKNPKLSPDKACGISKRREPTLNIAPHAHIFSWWTAEIQSCGHLMNIEIYILILIRLPAPFHQPSCLSACQ